MYGNYELHFLNSKKHYCIKGRASLFLKKNIFGDRILLELNPEFKLIIAIVIFPSFDTWIIAKEVFYNGCLERIQPFLICRETVLRLWQAIRETQKKWTDTLLWGLHSQLGQHMQWYCVLSHIGIQPDHMLAHSHISRKDSIQSIHLAPWDSCFPFGKLAHKMPQKKKKIENWNTKQVCTRQQGQLLTNNPINSYKIIAGRPIIHSIQ